MLVEGVPRPLDHRPEHHAVVAVAEQLAEVDVKIHGLHVDTCPLKRPSQHRGRVDSQRPTDLDQPNCGEVAGAVFVAQERAVTDPGRQP